LPVASTLNARSVLFSPEHKNIVMCNSNFQSQQNQTTSSALGEITADQILDMPIVFADEPSLVDIKQEVTDNSSYFITTDNNGKMVVKEEPVDEDENMDIMYPTMTKSTISEGLKIKQVCIITHMCDIVINF